MKNICTNKKNILCIIILFIIVLISIISIISFKNYKENQIISEIKSHYNTYVTTNKDTKIYIKDKNKYKEYGTISKNFNIELDKIDIKKSNQKYFKVKNEHYYIYYKDVKKIKDYNSDKLNSNYLVFNKNIITNDITKYIKDNTYIEINKSFELPIIYMDDTNYYVNYLDNIYCINKNSIKEEKGAENIIDNEANYISIINYNNIDSNKLNEQLDYLKNNNFYTITIEEYKNWLSGNIRLKEKAILLTLDNESSEIQNKINEYNYNIEIVKDTGIKFINNNQTTTKSSKLENLNRYEIKSSTTIDDFKKMCNGETIKEKVETSSISTATTKSMPAKDSNATQIAVLNYHFFYDSSIGESCNEGICLEVSKFREQLQYLKDNGYKTLKIEEFRAWMYGEIELPARSVLITIDDGAMGTGFHNGNKLIPILEEYDMYATLFLITGWWDISNYKSDHLDVQSHTNDMHTGSVCSNQPRGAQLLCSTKEQVITDLKKSIEITGSDTSFCFPFYAYNDSAIESIKEVGFKIAFIGGNVKATRNVDKYKIPRYPIYNTTTLNQFINMIN